MDRVIKALKTVNYRLLIAIFATLMIPAIYQTIRIFFLGDLPSDEGFNIASQLSWVNLFYEVIQEALILPLFFLLGEAFKRKEELGNKIRTGLLITTISYLLISIIIIVTAPYLVVFMEVENTLIEATITYIRLETIGALFSTLWRFMMLVLITIKKDRYLYLVLLIQVILSVIFDTFFISNLDISLKLGVNGIAITNIIVNLILVITAIILLYREKLPIFKGSLDFKWLREWFRVGKYSGLESLLRNFVFMVMIVRMMNVVSEQGTYWIANNFIWQWLLLPGLALADLVKKEVAEDETNIEKKTFGYILLVIIFSVIWLVSIPLWKPFLEHVMNVSEYQKVYEVVLLLTGFYLTFLFNNCLFDSTFYGLGKTSYMLIQSICIDAGYYGMMYILYITGIFIPSLTSVALMFGIGMVLDFIPTLVLYKIMLKKKRLRINLGKN